MSRSRRFCCRHGHRSQRLILTFLAPREQHSPFAHLADRERPAVVIAWIGRHNDERFYKGLGDLGIGAVGQRRQQKPNCCGSGGWPTVGEVRAKRFPATGEQTASDALEDDRADR